METRACTKCLVVKPLTDFHVNKRSKSGRHTNCKRCVLARMKTAYSQSPEVKRLRAREHYARNAEALNAKKRSYRKAHRKETQDRWNRWYRRLREEFLAEYGGACTCCGERRREFLTLEHVRHDGSAHRKKFWAYKLLMDIKKRGWPKDEYTILCMNCNWAERNGNPCPHRIERANLQIVVG